MRPDLDEDGYPYGPQYTSPDLPSDATIVGLGVALLLGSCALLVAALYTLWQWLV